MPAMLPMKAKMPCVFLCHSRHATEMKKDAEGNAPQKKSKVLGMELKNYLMSVLLHAEPADIKYSNTTDVMLSEEQVTEWSKSLAMLLATKSGQVTFREFLKSEFSDENIDFWLACEDYKKSQSEFLPVKAEKIYKEFVQTDAIKQVNIDFHTRKATAKKAQDPTPSSFDEAQKLVYVLMEKDSYPRFLKSQVYQNLLSKCQCKSLSKEQGMS